MYVSENNTDSEDDSSDSTGVVSGSSSTDSDSDLDSDNETMDDGQHRHNHEKNSQPMGRDLTQPSESDLALQETLLSATTKQKEMAEKLCEMQGVNDALKTEIAETKGSHARLLKHVNKLLERLDEKDTVLSNITMEKNELLENVAKATGLNNRIESDIQEARAGLLQATSAAAAAESTVASLRSTIEELRSENESLHEQVNSLIEYETLEAQAGLLQATSAAAAAESTVTSLRSIIEELRRENESLHEQVNNRIESEIQEARAGLLQATSAAAAAESTITSLRTVIEALRNENESLREQVNESRNIISVEQQVYAVPLTSTSSIGFDDMTTSTIHVHIPDGGSGCGMRSSSLGHEVSSNQGSRSLDSSSSGIPKDSSNIQASTKEAASNMTQMADMAQDGSSDTTTTNLSQSVLDAISSEVRRAHAQMAQTSPNKKENGTDKNEQKQQHRDDEREKKRKKMKQHKKEQKKKKEAKQKKKAKKLKLKQKREKKAKQRRAKQVKENHN